MTPYSALAGAAGLSHREAAEFLGVRLDTVKSWAAGRNRCPEGVLLKLGELINIEELAAENAFDQVSKAPPGISVVEVGFPADDYEARQLGFPCVGAWAAMAGRFLARAQGLSIKIDLVPRGSTSATAAAIAVRERGT